MKDLAIKLAVCAVLAIVALIGLEIYLRLSIPASSGESIYEYTLQTKRYKVMKPNATITAWGKELRTNQLGFRDNAPTLPAKQPGEFRIVVLGDSFTVSAGVDFGSIYTSLLQERLQERHPRVRIINLAVGGYNIIQYALVLQEVGLGLNPDLLLVAVFPENDFSLDTYETNYRVASGQETASPTLPWHETLYVYRAYLGKLEARVTSLLRGGEGKSGRQPEAGWERNLAALRAISIIAAKENIPLVLALLPSTWHFERQRELFSRVETQCRRHDLPCLNLLERFIASGIRESSLRLNALDAHPNEKYNAAVAEYLVPYLSTLVSTSEDRKARRAADLSVEATAAKPQ